LARYDGRRATEFGVDETLRFLTDHGYLVLFVFVFLEQVGAPLPAIPALLGVGALIGMGELVASVALAVATAASLLADVVWYRIGRSRGGRVLRLLCRISLEPDSCVRVTQNAFERWGGRSLLFAKFVPALNTIAPPMAGITGMPLPRFLLLDGLGALLYIGTFVLLGWIWSDQLEALVESITAVGGRVPLVVGSALLIWVLIKLIRRQMFLRDLRISRITPEELKTRMDEGDQVVVVDLRHSSDFDVSGVSIPGAIRVAVDEIDSGSDRIPRDREIVLFCT
jgi:membrane protein DedA with SNARE-associated domain